MLSKVDFVDVHVVKKIMLSVARRSSTCRGSAAVTPGKFGLLTFFFFFCAIFFSSQRRGTGWLTLRGEGTGGAYGAVSLQEAQHVATLYPTPRRKRTPKNMMQTTWICGFSNVTFSAIACG